MTAERTRGRRRTRPRGGRGRLRRRAAAAAAQRPHRRPVRRRPPRPAGRHRRGHRGRLGPVTNTSAGWLRWQGYLLGPLGLGGKGGDWAFANLGVLFALVIGFAATWLLTRTRVRAQESLPTAEPEPAAA